MKLVKLSGDFRQQLDDMMGEWLTYKQPFSRIFDKNRGKLLQFSQFFAR